MIRKSGNESPEAHVEATVDDVGGEANPEVVDDSPTDHIDSSILDLDEFLVETHCCLLRIENEVNDTEWKMEHRIVVYKLMLKHFFSERLCIVFLKSNCRFIFSLQITACSLRMLSAHLNIFFLAKCFCASVHEEISSSD